MGVVSAYRWALPLCKLVAILLAGSCAVSPQTIIQEKAEIPPVLHVVTAVMQHDMVLINGDLKDFVINDELESTMPLWAEVDPASLEADFPPEPKWIVPQETWSELPFLVRPLATFEHELWWGEDGESARTFFRCGHPQAEGLYAFSRPFFSRDGSLAIVNWTYYPHDGTFLGDVGYARLAKIQNEWQVVEWYKESIEDVMSRPCVKQL